MPRASRCAVLAPQSPGGTPQQCVRQVSRRGLTHPCSALFSCGVFVSHSPCPSASVRFSWPPPGSLCEGWGAGKARICSGERCRESVWRGRSARDYQRHGQGHGRGGEPWRCQKAGNCGRRTPNVRESAAGDRYDVGVCPAMRRFRPSQMRQQLSKLQGGGRNGLIWSWQAHAAELAWSCWLGRWQAAGQRCHFLGGTKRFVWDTTDTKNFFF